MEPAKIQGAADAPLFIVVFSDFACPYCNNVRQTLSQVQAAFPKDLKILFKHFPLERIHPTAMPAAEASECAADQGRFWAYHDKLFDAVDEWWSEKDPKPLFIGYAATLGLGVDEFSQCLNSGQKKAVVEANRKEGRHLFVNATPTCLLNGKKIITRHEPGFIKGLVERELAVLRKSRSL